MYNINLSIKWVNDLFYNNKKVIGILSESVNGQENIIIGIGVNLYKPYNIPIELKWKMGYIFDEEKDNVEKTIVHIIKEIKMLLKDNEIPQEYRIENIVIGNKVVFSDNNVGIIEDIDSRGRLVVRVNDNLEKVVSSNGIKIQL